MPLIEYEPGHHFPGVDRAHRGRVEPGVAGAEAGAEGLAERVVHRARRHRFRAARLLRQPDRHAEPGRARRRTACGTTTCTPRRCARRAGRASSPAATITATPWPASPSSPPAFPATTATCRSRTAILSEILLAQGYNTYMVGKWHLIPSSQESGAGPYDRWPLGRGFERFYGFLGGDTSQWNPDLVYDNHQVEPPATPEEGYHLTPDLVDKAVRVHRRRQAGRPGQAVLPALLPRRDPRPAPRPEGVGRQVRGQVRRRLGRLPHPHLRPAEGARHRARPTASCPATTPTCRTGIRSPPTNAASTPVRWRCSPGS